MIARNSIKVINTEVADKKLNRRIAVLPVGENALNNYLWDYENRLLKYLLLLVILFHLPDLQVFISNACLECVFFYQRNINTSLWEGQTKHLPSTESRHTLKPRESISNLWCQHATEDTATESLQLSLGSASDMDRGVWTQRHLHPRDFTNHTQKRRLNILGSNEGILQTPLLKMFKERKFCLTTTCDSFP